jgi:type IV secretory pathway VirB2 component (pilin)
MRGWGILLIALGVGSFILPMMGMQFRLLSIFGEHTGIAGAVMAVIGVILLGISFMAGKKSGETPKTQ